MFAYADVVLVLLVTLSIRFRYRLYRDACMALEGNYLKDLNVLGRDLSKVAIVDNSPYAYGFQVKTSLFQASRGNILIFAVVLKRVFLGLIAEQGRSGLVPSRPFASTYPYARHYSSVVS